VTLGAPLAGLGKMKVTDVAFEVAVPVSLAETVDV
jgi:hypothetical protein